MLMRPYRGSTSPWREMDRLRREMNRIFANWPQRRGWGVTPSYPAVNIWTKEDSAIVTAELPGVDPEDMDISVEGDSLTLRCTRQPEAVEEGTTYHRRERRCSSSARTLRLPFQVETNKVEAAFKNGVLSITLPRAEVDKPKTIVVKSG